MPRTRWPTPVIATPQADPLKDLPALQVEWTANPEDRVTDVPSVLPIFSQAGYASPTFFTAARQPKLM
jgi:hypothetical protein